jgi:predicted phosphodiesterase
MKFRICCLLFNSTLKLHLNDMGENIKQEKFLTSRLIGRNPAPQVIFILVFSFFNLLSLSGFSSTDTTAGKIVHPGNATTAIVKTGESFDVWFNSKPGQTVNSVVLKGPYNRVHIPSESFATLEGDWQYDPVSGNRYNRRITVTLPQGIPEDRYDLVLNTSSGEVISRGSVKVIREYKTNFKIFLISDSHLAQRGTEVLVPNKHTAFVEMANIINPDIVVNGGDVVYYHSDPSILQERMDLFYHGNEAEGLKGMHDFNAATFVVAGNHDFQEGGADGLPKEGYYDQKSDYWNRYHGLQNHFFRYGNSRFLIFNNGWLGYDWQWQYDRAVDWLNDEGSNGNLNVAIAHISRTEYMDSFARENNIGLYLLGHNHHLGDRNPYMLDEKLVMYYIRSVREYMEFMLFQVDDNNGTYEPVGYTNTNPDTDGFGLSTANNMVLTNDEERVNPDMSVWIYNLTLDYEQENNGSSSSNTATLVNKFDYAIPDARVRFIMPKGTAYSVSKGSVYQAFDGDEYHVVDVDIHLNATSTTEVEISPEDE